MATKRDLCSVRSSTTNSATASVSTAPTASYTMSCSTQEASAFEKEQETAKAALLEVLQNISCHLPRSVLLQCIQQVKEKQQQLDEQPDHSYHSQGQRSSCSMNTSWKDAHEIQSRNSSLTDTFSPLTPAKLYQLGGPSSGGSSPSESKSSLWNLFNTSSTRNFFALQKSAQDLFAATASNTGQDPLRISSRSAGGVTCGASMCASAATTADHSTVYSSDSTFLSTASPHAQLVRTLRSVERMLEEDMSMSSTSVAENQEDGPGSDDDDDDDDDDASSSDSSSSSFLSSSDSTSFLDQLSLEFDLMDTSLIDPSHETGNNASGKEASTAVSNHTSTSAGAASVVSKEVNPKPPMHRRFTGLRRASVTHAPSSSEGQERPGLRRSNSMGAQRRREPTRGLSRSHSEYSQDSERSGNLRLQRPLRRSTSDRAQQQQQDDDVASVSRLRQGRLRSSCRSNAGDNGDQRSVAGSIWSRRSEFSQQSSLASMASMDTSSVHNTSREQQLQQLPPQPTRLPTARYSGALLFVDISGFSRLSTMLSVEAFSNIVHDYFRKIVQQIELHGGDILKFAGDAILAEWKVTVDGTRTHRQAVYAASLCASNLVDLCSDVAVDIPENMKDPQESFIGLTRIPIRTQLHPKDAQDDNAPCLNLHAAVGFGDIVATHVGDGDRVELLILGDALRQVTEAVNKAKLGQVVVSPEVALVLRDVAEIRRPPKGLVSVYDEDEFGPNLLIAYKKERLIRVKPVARALATSSIQPFITSSRELVRGCEDLSVPMLQELYLKAAPYLHPVALFHEVSNTATETADASAEGQQLRRSSIMHQPQHQSHQQSHLSLAELRDVCTMFIQPELPQQWLTGKGAGSDEALHHLNQIMLITASEADRFSAHLRQMIVDDKGLVIIVNLGLRGSTFPNQVAERVMPFMDHVRTLLKSELSIDCRIGTTHGRAYCGLVAPGNRTEYTVLGPSVNLAARLMTHVRNPGIMVDEPIRLKAGHRPFRSLCPIRAKGYSTYIRIFIPETVERTGWKDPGPQFVGRVDPTEKIVGMAEAVMQSSHLYVPSSGLGGGTSRMVFLEGAYGVGKSSLMSHATTKIETLLSSNGHEQKGAHFVWRHVCCDEDSFKPFSVVRPLFLEIIRRKKEEEAHFQSVKLVGHSTRHEASEIDEAQMYVTLLHICLDARVPLHFVEAMAGLIFTTKLCDIGTWSDAAEKVDEWNRLAKFICQVFIQCTRRDRLVLLALDNVDGLDEMSWKLLQGLFYCGSNALILGAARSEHDLNINPACWKDLNCLHEKEFGGGEDRFHRMKLEPLIESEVSELVTNRMQAANDSGTPEDNVRVAHTVFLESKGNPLLANEILDILYPTTASTNSNTTLGQARTYTTVSNVDELVLNRLDSLAPAVRFVVDLGALMGSPFHLLDIVAVLERYHNMPTTDTTTYIAAKSNLQVAVDNGLLMTSYSECHGLTYTFTHSMWQETISRQNLDSWKAQMNKLIEEVLPETDPSKSEEEGGSGLPKVISFSNLAELDDGDGNDDNKENENENTAGVYDEARELTAHAAEVLKLDGSANDEQNARRLRAMAKMFRRKYKSSGRKGASETVRKLKGLLQGKKGKRRAQTS